MPSSKQACLELKLAQIGVPKFDAFQAALYACRPIRRLPHKHALIRVHSFLLHSTHKLYCFLASLRPCHLKAHILAQLHVWACAACSPQPVSHALAALQVTQSWGGGLLIHGIFSNEGHREGWAGMKGRKDGQEGDKKKE